MLDDEDYYVFTAPTKGKYIIKAVNTDIDHYYSLTCALYNNSYKCLASTRLDSGEGWKKDWNSLYEKRTESLYEIFII